MVVTEPDFQNVQGEGFNFGELRQRSVGFAIGSDDAASRVGDNKEESGMEVSSAAKQPNGRERERRVWNNGRERENRGEGIN
jgi:hypothetical protein